SGPSTAVFSNATVAGTTASGLVQGTYKFQLLVTDNSAASATSVVTVTVKAAALPAGNGTGLKGDYYNSVDLTGNIIASRTDATVNFNWTAAPVSGLSLTNFSVRWSGQVQPLYSETYTFYTQSDDGIRVWVNGQKLIDNWTPHGTIENSGTISLIAGTKYDIVVEYFQQNGGAVASLWWSSPSTAKAIIPASQLFPASSSTTTPPPPPTTGTGTGLKGDYYNSMDLSGNIIASQTDATVNFNWTAAPVSGLGLTYFSVRWSGQVLPKYTETYTFYTQSDDGIRVWVNGQKLIDNWTLHGTVENSGTISLTAGTKYDIVVEYFQQTGGAVASLWWSSPSTAKAIIPASQLFPAGSSTTTPPPPTTGTGTGLKGDYYNSMDLSGNIIASQTDATVNFNWTAAPVSGLSASYFSVRWSGQVLPKYTETYTFYTQSDDGIRVWVNGQKLIDNWTLHGTVENSGTISLTAGTKYDIIVEYFQQTGGAVASLWWSSPSTGKAIIPASQLFPASGGTTTPPATGTGLKGDYYNTMDLTGSIIASQTDATVNFNWTAAPVSGLGLTYFSVRWSGQVLPLYSETYTFYTQSDDGIRVWVNGQKLIDNWTPHGTVENSGTISLIAGTKYDIVVEYFQANGGAVASLWWSSPSTVKAIIPQSQLFPTTSASAAKVATASVTDALPASTESVALQTITVKTGLAPNPVFGGQPVRLNINSLSAAPATVQVMTATGATVYTQRITLNAGLTSSSIPTSGLSRGIYIINVISGGKAQSFRLVV
ncbi:MAG: T9SS type A sorting domain-containing protein, partial [Bacteroidetes bacterium]|nr:T9SS type A sorting domain-containing protein [Bacteroidota bacterium]